MASRKPFGGEGPGVARPILRLVAATMATQFLSRVSISRRLQKLRYCRPTRASEQFFIFASLG